jgi:hypothetical protein
MKMILILFAGHLSNFKHTLKQGSRRTISVFILKYKNENSTGKGIKKSGFLS